MAALAQPPGGGGAPADGRRSAVALAVYVLYLAAPFTAGLTALLGGVWAWRARPSADPWARGHLTRQVRLFWAALLIAAPLLLLQLIGEVLKWVLIGFPILWLVWLLAAVAVVWFLWSTVTGLLRLSRGDPA